MEELKILIDQLLVEKDLVVNVWKEILLGLDLPLLKIPPKNQEVKDEANVASTSRGEDALICSLENKEESWVLDSGASSYATSQKEFFKNYVSGNLGKFYLGNKQSCEIAGKCVVNIKLNGPEWELKNISKGAMIVVRGKKSGTLYKKVGACHLIAVATNESPNQWPQRLGHMSEKGIKVTHSKRKLPGLRRYMDYMLLTDEGEPEDYEEACQPTYASKWELAMKDYMKSLISNQTWELSKLPSGKKEFHNKLMYRVKENHDGSKRI
ncbi:hypothetical protein KIW84_013158 [Lathyrus oleraceus]|uniref:Retrovirus-related Pol polyprotein from transposon TNT 1-94-like beta-barrel domain-containing protein n=1 Tax=Pisum sativum TaxID=3888 RepID=A0A9D5BJN9_PEA|nr:hypothetical protein KIW84_013158 [Pisum sativum]